MAERYWSDEKAREIVSRVVVEGQLTLLTPAHLGNGDSAGGDEMVDMTLLLDPLGEAEGKETPLLTGSSIAGALRGYLRERQHGYAGSATADSMSTLLFGGRKGFDDEEQSRLIVDDALGSASGIELRDGVKLDSRTRTAADGAKFDLELWEAGTVFPLRFELTIDQRTREEMEEADVRQALATALAGLGSGEITLGARKRRGYGRVKVDNWRLREYDLTTPAGLLDWIRLGGKTLPETDGISRSDLTARLGGEFDDRRNRLTITATFSLDGSLLIRAGGEKWNKGPDMAHLSSRQADGTPAPVLSGTSLAGALRARIEAIANTLGSQRTTELLNSIFGHTPQDKKEKGKTGHASRLTVSEQVIENGVTNLVQNRVAIDRFTGGARETALFNQQPVFGDDNSAVTISLSLADPADHEVGLLLLALRDLWTGDLTLGGERSVGRGRLNGSSAKIEIRMAGNFDAWELKQVGQRLEIEGDAGRLERYVSESLPQFLHHAA